MEELQDGKFYWKCVLCKLWVTKEHLESNKHQRALARSQQTQNQVHVQNPTITELEMTVARLGHRIGLMEEQVEGLCDVATKLVEDLKTNTERIAALENLVAKAIGEKFEMFEKLDKAAKLIAELEKRVVAVEPRESSSSWSGDATAGRWQNQREWLTSWPATAEESRWAPSSSSTW